MSFSRKAARKNRSVRALTMVEMLVSVVITALVMSVAVSSYVTLQKSFAFAAGWATARSTEVRVLDSMSMDLRNLLGPPAVNATSTTSTGSQVLLTGTMPKRYSSYELSGALAGDPARDATRLAVTPASSGKVVTTTSGSLGFPTGIITVLYTQTGNTISRTVNWNDTAGTAQTASRTVATFSNPVTIQFNSLDGNAFVSADTTIIPTITAVFSTYNGLRTGTATMADTVFLRSTVFR